VKKVESSKSKSDGAEKIKMEPEEKYKEGCTPYIHYTIRGL